MQHEILLALAGCPGSTFSVSKQSGLLEVVFRSRCLMIVCEGGRKEFSGGLTVLACGMGKHA